MGYEAALREAWDAFYELPWKSSKMFDAMDRVAESVFRQSDASKLPKTAKHFVEAFKNNTRTEEQKVAIQKLETLLFLDE